MNGERSASRRPAVRHAHAAIEIGGGLRDRFGRGRSGPGGWWLLFEPGLHLGPHVLMPDLAGWRRERLPTLPDAPFFTDPPDWVCEVLSPSTARLERVEKLPIYASFELRHVWLVDPIARTLEVLRDQSGHWLLVGAWADEAVVRAEPLGAHAPELAGRRM